MKILDLSFDTNLNEFNAAYTHAFSLAKHLSKLGNKIFLVIGGDENKIINRRNLKILTVKFNFTSHSSYLLINLFLLLYKNIKLFFHVTKIKNIKRFDIIYERHNPIIFIGLILSKIYRIPIFYEVNGVPDEEIFDLLNIKNKFLRSLIFNIYKMQLKNARGVMVQTKELKEIVRDKMGINKIFIVENGVDLIKFPPQKKSNKVTLCSVGILDNRHNLSEIFDATSRIKDEFKFFIIGERCLKEKYLKKYAYDKRFSFMGKLPHKQALDYIANSDICIASYGLRFQLFKKYGFYFCPLKLLEYSAAGKPTVMYGLSNSFTKIFEKGNACFVVNSKDKFIKELRSLIKNKRLREEMGRKAKEIAKKFTWEKAAKKTERILKNATKTNKK